MRSPRAAAPSASSTAKWCCRAWQSTRRDEPRFVVASQRSGGFPFPFSRLADEARDGRQQVRRLLEPKVAKWRDPRLPTRLEQPRERFTDVCCSKRQRRSADHDNQNTENDIGEHAAERRPGVGGACANQGRRAGQRQREARRKAGASDGENRRNGRRRAPAAFVAAVARRGVDKAKRQGEASWIRGVRGHNARSALSHADVTAGSYGAVKIAPMCPPGGFNGLRSFSLR